VLGPVTFTWDINFGHILTLVIFIAGFIRLQFQVSILWEEYGRRIKMLEDNQQQRLRDERRA
jgi:hypothetical protein